MRRLLTALLLLMSCATLWAADNTVILTPGSGVTMRSVDIGGGVQSSMVVLGSSAGAAIYGTAGTANANVITVQGIASGTAAAANITAVGGTAITLGQKTDAASFPVVLPADQVVTLESGRVPVNLISGQAGVAGGAGTTGATTVRVVLPTDQTNIPTINGASAYETVAASQTAQSMGATGATGDYLSHCVITPGTTSPGVVTILDNATSIVAFAGGASSVSTLIPFTVPIGAVSVSGAWKITTGANVTVVCVGRFT